MLCRRTATIAHSENGRALNLIENDKFVDGGSGSGNDRLKMNIDQATKLNLRKSN